MMSAVATPETLQLEREGEWLTIRFNRPGVRNALSDTMVGELLTVLEAAADDAALRGITLRGNGGVFCAGGDLKNFRETMQSAAGSDAIEAASRRAGDLFARLYTMPQVVLILVEGAAMAGGLGIVCAGDVVAVTRDAKFALTEVTLGLPPAQIAPYVVERLGLPAARRLMLTAARFDGVEAKTIGLADHLAEDAAGLADIEAEVRHAVHRCAPKANAVTKRLAIAAAHAPPDRMRDEAARDFAGCLAGEEGREGVAAYLEKRKPGWAQ